MKRLILASMLVLILSCNNRQDDNSRIDRNGDSLRSNPHGVPTHVDTTTHEDGLSNQSAVPDTNTIQ